MTSGGWNKGIPRKKSTKEKISKKLKGRKHSEKTKLKQRLQGTSPLVGKKRSKETIEKIKRAKRKNKDKYIRHHVDGDNSNDSSSNILSVVDTIHQSMHRQAYNYLVSVNKQEDFIKWFCNKFNLIMKTEHEGTRKIEEKKIVTVCVSGYFDPMHIGHCRYLKEAKKLGNKLIVIVNNDKQTIDKKGYFFYNQFDRLAMIRSFKFVDSAVISKDKDYTVCRTLKMLKPDIFANGGDRFSDNVPEKSVCEKLGTKMVFGVGGAKVQSSSELVENYRKNIKKYEGDIR